MTTRRRVRITAATAHRNLDRETVLVQLDRGSVFSVQGVAQRAWQLLVLDPDPASVAATLAQEFNASDDVIVTDLDRFIDDLAARGFLTWEPAE